MAETGSCDSCAYYGYDEDDEAYYCMVDMDEDELGRLLTDRRYQCAYYRSDDEYKIVRRQM